MRRGRRGEPGHERCDRHHAVDGIRRPFDLDPAGGDEVGERIGRGRPPMRVRLGRNSPDERSIWPPWARLAVDSGMSQWRDRPEAG
jgi:hypothetical protein